MALIIRCVGIDSTTTKVSAVPSDSRMPTACENPSAGREFVGSGENEILCPKIRHAGDRHDVVRSQCDDAGSGLNGNL